VKKKDDGSRSTKSSNSCPNDNSSDHISSVKVWRTVVTDTGYSSGNGACAGTMPLTRTGRKPWSWGTRLGLFGVKWFDSSTGTCRRGKVDGFCEVLDCLLEIHARTV
jgi:hypothetical protein